MHVHLLLIHGYVIIIRRLYEAMSDSDSIDAWHGQSRADHRVYIYNIIHVHSKFTRIFIVYYMHGHVELLPHSLHFTPSHHQVCNTTPCQGLMLQTMLHGWMFVLIHCVD